MSEGEQQQADYAQEEGQQQANYAQESDQQQAGYAQEGGQQQVDYARWQRELQYAVGSEELLVELLHATDLYTDLRLGEKRDANNRLLIDDQVWWVMVLLSPSFTNSEAYKQLPKITVRTYDDTILVIVALIQYEKITKKRLIREIDAGRYFLSSIGVQQADYARIYSSLYRTDKIEFTVSHFECIVPGTYVTAVHYELTHWLRIMCEYRLKTGGAWSDDQSERCESVAQVPLFENNTPPTHPLSLPTSFESSSSIEMKVASEPAIRSPSSPSSHGNFKRFSPLLSPPSVAKVESSSESPTSNKYPFDDYTFYPIEVDLNMMFDKINELKKELDLLKPMLANDAVRSRPSNNSLEELIRTFEVQRRGSVVTSDSADEVSDLPDDELESAELQLQENPMG